MDSISGPAAQALQSLTPSQLSFISSLPKAELHAHLNGCIPLTTLQSLAKAYIRHDDDNDDNDNIDNTHAATSDLITAGLERLAKGVVFGEILDFFQLFPAIYALTSTPHNLSIATRAVLASFLDGPNPQCTYLELRTTPRATPAMTRLGYLESVLGEVEREEYRGRAALIVSVDRRMEDAEVEECVRLAVGLKETGRRVVGVDLCGDPTAGDMTLFGKHFKTAKDAGLGITLHIAETPANTPQETLHLLSFNPDRLGHATFLPDEARDIVARKGICVEVCLSSNLLTKTTPQLSNHPINRLLSSLAPSPPSSSNTTSLPPPPPPMIALCTDDTLPFRTSLQAEYALLMAEEPLGLGMGEEGVRRVAEMGMGARFGFGGA